MLFCARSKKVSSFTSSPPPPAFPRQVALLTAQMQALEVELRRVSTASSAETFKERLEVRFITEHSYGSSIVTCKLEQPGHTVRGCCAFEQIAAFYCSCHCWFTPRPPRPRRLHTPLARVGHQNNSKF